MVEASFVPEGENAEAVKANIEARSKILEETKEVAGARANLTDELLALKEQKRALMAEISPLLKSARSEAFTVALEESEKTLEELFELNKQLGDAQGEFYRELLVEGRLNRDNVHNIPAHIQELSEQYAAKDIEYKTALRALIDLQREELLNGKLTIAGNPEATTRMLEIGELLWGAKSTGEMGGVEARLAQITIELSQAQSRSIALERALYEKLTEYGELVPGSIHVESERLIDILSKESPDTLREYGELINVAQKLWNSYWKARPLVEKEDLHKTLPEGDE
jgi:hypothetical protein